ncbi:MULTISPECIES: oligosaccharide flippase family protein [Bacillus]|jgi:O-antigen/teichoic acid export membrane protein|uniref:Sugar translocase n=4 Tax=Bacillus cereus group TaxID=86661 RepID=A0A9X0G6N5_BACCE|nr:MULTISPECIES: oligosaccharide flippase family protein [Bacillus]MDV8109020.1 oligosaccharide flippase family protein [Bacillus sp. BAU-SS-2023]CJB97835.1 polysaccharide flippase transporter [Streptococcus pneumoniae]AKE19653.1 Oligosaccharide translocase (flippase) [Bacillus cereus]AQQ66090.1 Polysaccharide biosynthesis protein [Bacillus cereus]ARO67616.1 Oligosaccharide translocase (Flippase) [Bacillus cereus]
MKTNKILKNASYLFVGNITVRFVLAIATIFFARYVSPSDYGMFTTALAVSAVICYFTDAGLTHTFMREGTRSDANISVLISSYLRIRLILAIVISVLFAIFAQFFYPDAYLRAMVYWVVLPTMFGATLQGVGMAYFQVTERMQFTAIISVLQGVTAAAALLLGMSFQWSLMMVAAMYGVSSLVTGVIAFIMTIRYTKVHKGWDKGILDQLLIFTINGIIIMLLPQLGPIILEKVSTYNQVGFFGAASKIPAVLYQIPGVIAAAFYPRLFAFGNEKNIEEHRKLSSFELKLMSFLGMGISIPFIADPSFWIVSLLGEEYAPAGDALAILAFMVILQSINYPLADNLTTIGQQWKRATTMTIGLVVAIIGYIVLGSKYGMMGAAAAAILTEITLLIGFTLFIRKGMQLLVKGVIFNSLAFIISYGIYRIALINLPPLIALTLTGILYGIIGIGIDPQIRGFVLGFIKQKLIRKHA